MIYGYCRVSTESQASDGQSLAVQQRAIEGYAMQHGLEAPTFFIERGVSGSIPIAERPEGAKLLATMKPGDSIVTTRLDRMFRSSIDALETLNLCKRDNIGLAMLDLGGDVTRDSISKLVFSILSAVAESERDRIRERIREVKKDQKKRGAYLGGVKPFGFDLVDGALVPNEREQIALTAARQWHATGHSSRQISKGLLDTYGVKLSHVSISKMIKTTQ